ncbi:hypothetical protein NOF04DRAFT_1321031 [Fusarium oxysporum II5]|nr:hypothetical protein NOF04DRAFT_1321031 [Fusarium oxysporum II5]
MMVTFALATIAHAIQAIRYRKPYYWTIAMSGLLETLAYLFRILSINNPVSLGRTESWATLRYFGCNVSHCASLEGDKALTYLASMITY